MLIHVNQHTGISIHSTLVILFDGPGADLVVVSEFEELRLFVKDWLVLWLFVKDWLVLWLFVILSYIIV